MGRSSERPVHFSVHIMNTPKILIAVKCCHIRQDFADASRQTWIKNLRGIDCKVFYGHGQHELKDDEVQVDAPDGYYDLATKMYEMICWAYKQGYDYVLQLDDDTYVRPSRLLQSDFFNNDFVAGVSVGIEHNRLFQYVNGQSASGPGYWLSRKSMEIISNSPRPGHGWPDEPWVGQVLERSGVKVCRTDSMGCYGNIPRGESFELSVGCRMPKEETVIAEWEYNPKEMLEVHRQWQTGTRFFPQGIAPSPDKKHDVIVGSCHFKNPA